MTSLITVLAIIVAAFLITAFIFFIKPVMGIGRLEKLQSQPGPTAEFFEYMPDTDKIFGWANDLVEMGARLPGTDAGLRAQNYVREKLESFGLDEVEVLPSETNLWNYSDWSLCINGKKISCYYISSTLNKGGIAGLKTGSKPLAYDADISSDIVYVGKGRKSDFSKADVKGRIVMADVDFSKVPIALSKGIAHMYYDPDKTMGFTEAIVNPYSANTFPYNYFYAMEAGAAGFIGILTDYIDNNEFNNEDYTYMGSDMAIPGVWVTKKDGEKIKSMLNAGTSSAQMKMSVAISKVSAAAITGKLFGQKSKDGNIDPEETIIVQSHYDSSTPGGTEDASGTAVVLAMAEFFSKIERKHINRTIYFTLMDTHFGEYESHVAFREKYLTGNHKFLADVSIEHIARKVKEKDGRIVPTDELEPRIVFIDKLKDVIRITKEELVRHRYGKTVIMPTSFFDEPPTDAEQLHEVGLPILSLISGPIYLYDNMDTADKIAVEELRPTAETFSDIVWRMLRLPTSSFRK